MSANLGDGVPPVFAWIPGTKCPAKCPACGETSFGRPPDEFRNWTGWNCAYCPQRWARAPLSVVAQGGCRHGLTKS